MTLKLQAAALLLAVGMTGTPSLVAAAGDPAAGNAFFHATHSGGKPDTPSCTTCHTNDPRAMGKTRAGKAIDPMAVSVNPNRFTDPAKVEKWFIRNCNTVLGRECTAGEKADVLAYLRSI